MIFSSYLFLGATNLHPILGIIGQLPFILLLLKSLKIDKNIFLFLVSISFGTVLGLILGVDISQFLIRFVLYNLAAIGFCFYIINPKTDIKKFINYHILLQCIGLLIDNSRCCVDLYSVRPWYNEYMIFGVLRQKAVFVEPAGFGFFGLLLLYISIVYRYVGGIILSSAIVILSASTSAVICACLLFMAYFNHLHKFTIRFLLLMIIPLSLVFYPIVLSKISSDSLSWIQRYNNFYLYLSFIQNSFPFANGFQRVVIDQTEIGSLSYLNFVFYTFGAAALLLFAPYLPLLRDPLKSVLFIFMVVALGVCYEYPFLIIGILMVINRRKNVSRFT